MYNMRNNEGKRGYTGKIKAVVPEKVKLGQNKSELVASMSEKQKTETIKILSGLTKVTPRTEKVKEFFRDIAPNAGERMRELSEQNDNMNVAYNATKDILDRAGVTNQANSELDSHFLGENEALLIIKRRFQPESYKIENEA